MPDPMFGPDTPKLAAPAASPQKPAPSRAAREDDVMAMAIGEFVGRETRSLATDLRAEIAAVEARMVAAMAALEIRILTALLASGKQPAPVVEAKPQPTLRSVKGI